MSSEKDPGFFKKRIRSLQRRWQDIAGSEYDRDAAVLQ